MLKMTAECGSTRGSLDGCRSWCTALHDMTWIGPVHSWAHCKTYLPNVHSDSYSAAIRPKARVV